MSLWISVANADTYFSTRLNATAWTSATSGAKTAALTTAQNDIFASGIFTFVDADGNDLAEDPTNAMKHAVCEQALFLLANPDAERRIALQAQGVTAAGIVEEQYRGGVPSIVITPRAMALLQTYGVSGTGSFRVEK